MSWLHERCEFKTIFSTVRAMRLRQLPSPELNEQCTHESAAGGKTTSKELIKQWSQSAPFTGIDKMANIAF